MLKVLQTDKIYFKKLKTFKINISYIKKTV